MEIGLGPVYLKLKEILFKGTPSRNHEYYNWIQKKLWLEYLHQLNLKHFDWGIHLRNFKKQTPSWASCGWSSDYKRRYTSSEDLDHI